MPEPTPTSEHGPHQLRGIEISKGRPILYSLGNFLYDDLRTPVGADMFEAYGREPRVHTDAEVTIDEEARFFAYPVWYESVVTVSRFEQNQLAELRLYPVELRHSNRFADSGVPRLVTGSQALVILERLQRLSKPFGTAIVISNDIGVIGLRW